MSIQRHNANKRTAATLVFTHSPGFPAWQPNWISYRSSRANVWRRKDLGDTAATCSSCSCETDVNPQPHSPKCDAPV